MNMENSEKRTTNRVLFAPEDNATVHFYSFDTDKIIAAKVVNMSVGGICVALSKDDIKKIHDEFLSRGYNVRVFDPAGQDDIGGGCGQLWYFQKKEVKK